MYYVTVYVREGVRRRELKYFSSEDYGGSLKATFKAASAWRDKYAPLGFVGTQTVPSI